MIPDDKTVLNLIKKIQKKCEKDALNREAKVKKELPQQEDEASEMFREMKKLPFSD